MKTKIDRRRFIQKSFLFGVGFITGIHPVFSLAKEPIKRKIHSSGEMLPVIGMGTWQTFDIDKDSFELDTRVKILETFIANGGAMIDSSPMYGASEEIIGLCLKQIAQKHNLFSATKVWTWGKAIGINQMENSRLLWGVDRFDLMQIHNMLDWEVHLETLRQWKQEKRIRYIGVTTSHGRRHQELERVLKQHNDFDFVQFTYNIVDREVEKRLLPLAADKGISVIINRPFQGGNLFNYVQNKPLPAWANEIDCNNWAQFFLKFIVSHKDVTCAIPATSRIDHMQENMGACFGKLPDPEMRNHMIDYFKNI